MFIIVEKGQDYRRIQILKQNWYRYIVFGGFFLNIVLYPPNVSTKCTSFLAYQEVLMIIRNQEKVWRKLNLAGRHTVDITGRCIQGWHDVYLCIHHLLNVYIKQGTTTKAIGIVQCIYMIKQEIRLLNISMSKILPWHIYSVISRGMYPPNEMTWQYFLSCYMQG